MLDLNGLYGNVSQQRGYARQSITFELSLSGSGSYRLLGKPDPYFVLATVANAQGAVQVRLSDLRGSEVLLSFWSIWCSPSC